MDSSSSVAAAASPTEGPRLSPLQRAVAVFVRPTKAWTGLEHQVQWWFPLLVAIVIGVGFSVALHDRSVVPMVQDQFEEQVANGQMSAAQAEQAEKMMAGPIGLMWTLIPQLVAIPLITFLIGLVVWFGVAFILGRKIKYRMALEVACWASLVNIPAQILFSALAWSKQTMRGIHIGFGMLLPESDPPSKLFHGLGIVLDALGPFSLWYLAVGIIGAAAVSGAPRRSVAWVLGGLYLAIVLFSAGVAALFGSGS